MAYIGRAPLTGNYSKLDDIGPSFNGVTTSFALTVSGSSVVPSQAVQLLISVGGVIQEPETAYTVSGSNITFTEAPSTSADFFGIVLGDTLDIGVPSDNTVSAGKLQTDAVVTAKIQDSAVTTAKIQDGSITGAKLNVDSTASANVVYTHRANSYSNAQSGTIKALGVYHGLAGNTVTLTLSDSNFYSLTSNANLTMANPTGITAGQAGSLTFTANGSYTVSWGSYWRFAGGTAPTMSTTAGKQDRIDYYVAAANTIHAVATIDLLGSA